MKYRVYEDEKHHLGLISYDGKHMTPAVYDEIQIIDDDKWYCRAYINWDYFYPGSGTFSVKTRVGGIEGSDGRKVVNINSPTTIEIESSMIQFLSVRLLNIFLPMSMESLDSKHLMAQ